MSGYQTFEGEGFTIESNTQTRDQMAENFKANTETPTEKPKPAPSEPVDDPDDKGDGELPEAAQKPGEPKKGHPRHDPNLRVREAALEAKEAKRERDQIRAQRDEIERRAAAAEAELAKLKAPKTEEPKPAAVSDRPKLQDFESIEDHAEAVAKWAYKRERDQEREAETKAKTEAKRAEFYQEHQKRVDSFIGKLDKAIEENPLISDYGVLKWTPLSQMKDLSKASQVNFMAQQFIDREKGFDLLMYLETHPEDVERISALDHPAKIEYAFDLIEKTLGVATTATNPEPERNKAAPPARPVTGGAPIGKADPEKMSFDEYAKWQAAEDKRYAKANR